MSTAYRKIIVFNGYPLSFMLALALHAALLAGLIYLQTRPPDPVLRLEQPTVIKALFIDENPQIVNMQRREERLARQREEQAAEAARQALIERQELERQQREQAELEEQARLEEEQRQREEAEAAALEAEQQQAEAEAAAARSEFELVQSASALIKQYVEEQWSRPPSARNGMSAVLRIQMVPTGHVTSVVVEESSRDAAFDRSAENAIQRAAPFTELQQLPIRVFNEHFRTFTFTFQPENLLN